MVSKYFENILVKNNKNELYEILGLLSLIVSISNLCLEKALLLDIIISRQLKLKNLQKLKYFRENWKVEIVRGMMRTLSSHKTRRLYCHQTLVSLNPREDLRDIKQF